MKSWIESQIHDLSRNRNRVNYRQEWVMALTIQMLGFICSYLAFKDIVLGIVLGIILPFATNLLLFIPMIDETDYSEYTSLTVICRLILKSWLFIANHESIFSILILISITGYTLTL